MERVYFLHSGTFVFYMERGAGNSIQTVIKSASGNFCDICRFPTIWAVIEMKKLINLGLLLCLVASPLAAEEGAVGPAVAPEPPELPPQVESGEALEPEVTIIKSEEKTVEEYRVDGKLVMVKITPVAGPAYYLLDSDGDGTLDTQEDDPRSASVQQWEIFSWD